MSIIINGMPLNEYIREQMEQGEVLENVCGTQEANGVKSRLQMSNVYGVQKDFLLTNNARVTIKRNGKSYTIKGDRIEKKNGQWYVDGEPVDWNTIGGEYKEENVSVEVYGNVDTLRLEAGKVTVKGDVQQIHTASGDVECESVVNIHTMSGNVTCGSVAGNVRTMSGNIRRR